MEDMKEDEHEDDNDEDDTAHGAFHFLCLFHF